VQSRSNFVKHALQNSENDCCQWLSDSFRVHQIRFRPGLRPGLCWGILQRSSKPRSYLRGPYCKGREDRKGRDKVRGGIREREGTPPNSNSWSDAAAPRSCVQHPSVNSCLCACSLLIVPRPHIAVYLVRRSRGSLQGSVLPALT